MYSSSSRRRVHPDSGEGERSCGSLQVDVFWEGSGKPLTTLKCGKDDVKVSSLRRMLRESGRLPTYGVEFLVNGVPLNEVQEALCGIRVFGAGPCLQATIQTKSENLKKDFDLEAAVHLKEQNKKGKAVHKFLREAFGKVSALFGRQVLIHLLERIDENRKNELRVETILKLLMECCKSSKLFGKSSANDMVFFDGTLSEVANERVTYFEIVRAMPRHMQRRELEEEQEQMGGTISVRNEILGGLQKLQLKGFVKKVPASDVVSSSEIPKDMKFTGKGDSISISLRLAGDVIDFEKSSGLCTFRCPSVSLLELFELHDETSFGYLSLGDLREVLGKYCVGRGEFTNSQVRDAMIDFKTQKGYHYATIADTAVPKSEEEKAAILQSVTRKVRTTLQKKSFSGLGLRALFKYFDKDGLGTICTAEFQKCLEKESSFRLSRDELAEICRRFDPSNAGKVSYAEFVAFVEADCQKWVDVRDVQTKIVKHWQDKLFDFGTGVIDFTKCFSSLDNEELGLVMLEALAVEGISVMDLRRVFDCIFATETSRRQALQEKKNVFGLTLWGLRKFIESVESRSATQLWEEFRNALLSEWQYLKNVESWQQEFDSLRCNFQERNRHIKRSVGRVPHEDFISAESLYRSCPGSLKETLTKKEAHEMMQANFGGLMTKQQFMKFMFPVAARSAHDVAALVRSEVKRRSLAGMAIRKVLKGFDPEGSGMLTQENILKGMVKLKFPLEEREIRLLLQSNYLKRDAEAGLISFEEFIRFALGGGVVTHQMYKPKIEIKAPSERAEEARIIEPTRRSQVKHYLSSSRPF